MGVKDDIKGDNDGHVSRATPPSSQEFAADISCDTITIESTSDRENGDVVEGMISIHVTNKVEHTCSSNENIEQNLPVAKRIRIKQESPPRRGISFDERLEALKLFKAEHGHLNVPCSMKSMYNWCANVRSSMRNVKIGKKPSLMLMDDQVHSLEEIGFNFNLIPRRTSKDTSARSTCNERNVGGAENLQGNDDADKYSDPDSGNDDDDNDESLDDDDSSESDDDDDDDDDDSEEAVESSDSEDYDEEDNRRKAPRIFTFNERILALKKFKSEHGHLDITAKLDASMYHWCRNIRYSYFAKLKGTKPSLLLTADRIASLQEVGFDFYGRRSDHRSSPETGVVKSCNDSNDDDREMPMTHECEETTSTSLGSNIPQEDESDSPETCGTETKASLMSFNNRVKALEKFRDVHGNLRVTRTIDNSLARWCENIRYSYRGRMQGTQMNILLTDERIARLEELGFDFFPTGKVHHSNPSTSASASPSPSPSPSIPTFNDRFEALKRFKAVHGHVNVIPEMNNELAEWCESVKSSYHARGQEGKKLDVILTDDHIASLNGLGFDFGYDLTSIDAANDILMQEFSLADSKIPSSSSNKRPLDEELSQGIILESEKRIKVEEAI